jgi:hypothetical protein
LVSLEFGDALHPRSGPASLRSPATSPKK